MTVQELADSGLFALENEGDTMEREITKCFCCDLLSVAMGRAPAGCAWVTVMGNMNTLAVASLADAACVIMAEGVPLDAVAANKAKMQGIFFCVFLSCRIPPFREQAFRFPPCESFNTRFAFWNDYDIISVKIMKVPFPFISGTLRFRNYAKEFSRRTIL